MNLNKEDAKMSEIKKRKVFIAEGWQWGQPLTAKSSLLFAHLACIKSSETATTDRRKDEGKLHDA